MIMVSLPEIKLIKLFPEEAVEVATDDHVETPTDDDVWSAVELGCNVSNHEAIVTANIKFAGIEQDWFKIEAKKFVKHIARNGFTFNLVKMRLTSLKEFSSFLASFPNVVCMGDIDRSVIIEFINYLSVKKARTNWKNNVIQTLRMFFEAGLINEWFTAHPYLIRDGDSFKADSKALPRYIPDDVIRQLEEHMQQLPEPVMRMILVIKECGLRVGELCQLPLDCLKRDSKGGWFIQFMRLKIRKETTIPISIELADCIQQQQRYIQEHLNDFPYLFCSGRHAKETFVPNNRMMTRCLFNWRLNKLAKDFNICDSTGKLWEFQSHQFRHTLGTGMINNGVPQHIVQRFLGHESPEMTSVYAHIHDSTLRYQMSRL
jgi:integrase/recombinase XerD